MNTESVKRKLEWAMPVLFTVAFTSVYILKSGNLSQYKFWGLMILSCILYFMTSYKSTPEPGKILPLYLLATGIQLLHFAEELIGEFYIRHFTEILHTEPHSMELFTINQMVIYFLFLIAAIGIYKRWKITMILVWYMIMMMLLANAVQHPIYALKVRGYFPGLYTSIAGWILGPILFKRMWDVRKKVKNPQ